MSNARFILVGLICVSPLILLWDGLITQGLVSAVAAAALAIIARDMRPNETGFLISIVRPAAAVAAIPALWIVFQVLPLKMLAHPIWRSAESAVGHPLTGAISVDRGASLVALGHYLLVTAIALIAAAVAVDRQRAEWLLFALTAAVTAMGLLMLADQLLFSAAILSSFARTQVLDCVAVETMIASTAAIRTIERFETRASNPNRSIATLRRTFVACCAALAICTAALISGGNRDVFVATGCGLATFAAVELVRRFGLGTWGTAVIAVPALIVAIFVATVQPAERGRSLLLFFATPSSAAAIPASERVLQDAPLVGTGAGSFAALAPIYRGMNDPPAGQVAATTAAAFAIGLGRPMLWFITAATIAAIIMLLMASLQRGRDSFYSAMGGSYLLALLLLGFTNSGLLGLATGLIVASGLGLALAQCKSRAASP